LLRQDSQRHLDPHVVEEAKHWQYILRHLAKRTQMRLCVSERISKRSARSYKRRDILHADQPSEIESVTYMVFLHVHPAESAFLRREEAVAEDW
jgi:3-deoxy-D-manno-octulosonic-acid transferase